MWVVPCEDMAAARHAYKAAYSEWLTWINIDWCVHSLYLDQTFRSAMTSELHAFKAQLCNSVMSLNALTISVGWHVIFGYPGRSFTGLPELHHNLEYVVCTSGCCRYQTSVQGLVCTLPVCQTEQCSACIIKK